MCASVRKAPLHLYHSKSEPCVVMCKLHSHSPIPLGPFGHLCALPLSSLAGQRSVGRAGTACVATAGEEGGAADRRGGGASFCQVPRAYGARLSLISNGGDLVGQQAPGGRLGASRPPTRGPSTGSVGCRVSLLCGRGRRGLGAHTGGRQGLYGSPCVPLAELGVWHRFAQGPRRETERDRRRACLRA